MHQREPRNMLEHQTIAMPSSSFISGVSGKGQTVDRLLFDRWPRLDCGRTKRREDTLGMMGLTLQGPPDHLRECVLVIDLPPEPVTQRIMIAPDEPNCCPKFVRSKRHIKDMTPVNSLVKREMRLLHTIKSTIQKVELREKELRTL
jgi:hypothetical protein